jgi:hypothetical protein
VISIRGNKEELEISYNNISMVYYNLKNNQKAIEYALKALKLSEKLLK